MMSSVLFAAGECAKSGCCPLTLAGAAVGGLVVGFVLGRLTKKGHACACKKSASPAPAKKQPVRREGRPQEPRQPIPAGSVEIYVGNLSYDMTEDELRKTFEAFGAVSSTRIVTNSFNGKSKGFGFVVMPNRPEAEKAIAAMSEKEVMGRKMRVNEAQNTLKADA